MTDLIKYKNDLLAFFLALLLSVSLGFIIIPLLRKLKAGQNVLNYVEKHAGKAGTTTMGGFIFALPILLLFPIFKRGNSILSWLSLLVAFAFLIVGFLDDFIKVRSGNNQGLTAKQKIIFQAVISLITGIFAYFRGYTLFFIPFLNIYLDFGIFGCILIFFVFFYIKKKLANNIRIIIIRLVVVILLSSLYLFNNTWN